MELAGYIRALLRGWWIILLTTLAALMVALIYTFITTPMYRSQASFIVSPNKAVVPNQNLIDSMGTLDKRSIIATYAEVVNSKRIYNETLQALQLNPNDMMGYSHSAVVLPEANVLVLSVTGPDPQATAALANSIGQRGVNFVKGLYQAYDINLLDPAVPPTAPISPQPLRDLPLALALGLVVGSALALVTERVRTPLAAIPRGARYQVMPSNLPGQYSPRR